MVFNSYVAQPNQKEEVTKKVYVITVISYTWYISKSSHLYKLKSPYNSFYISVCSIGLMRRIHGLILDRANFNTFSSTSKNNLEPLHMSP
jgi:hypothetical protein